MSTPRPLPPRPSILLVDDEAAITDTLMLSLQNDFEVEAARSASEAELMMATKSYDVIVCDHLMPDEEGLNFLTRARIQFPKVQRILMTGYINPELLSRSTSVAGLAACLMKPVKPADLISAIRIALPV